MRYLMSILAGICCLSLFVSCDMLAKNNLESAVIAALKADQRTMDYHFEVSVQAPGEILITGEVGASPDIDAVTEIAKKVKGVSKVTNNCSVPEESSGMMQDTVVPGVGGGLGF